MKLSLYKKALCALLLCLVTGLCGCQAAPGGMTPEDYSAITNPSVSGDISTTAKSLVENPINFEELQDINPDLYAWIEIPDTNINYPVAQSSNEDDNFYLHHNYLGNYEFAGTIYSQRQNSKYFADPVTVLYGHNMLNGSMFANLHKFSDPEFFESHDTMYVYIKNRILTYEIFAAFEYDDRHILNSFDFANKEVFATYLNDCLHPHSANVNVRDGVELTTEDSILVLSTCTDYNSNLRYLVQGVLINEQETY